jgi:hypothetical protein
MSALTGVQELQTTIVDIQGASANKEALSESRGLITWLQAGIDNKMCFRRYLDSRSVGTGQWLLDHPLFKEWSLIDGPINLLWLYGPGMKLGIAVTYLCTCIAD